jgi:hypothetical protein
MKEGGGGRERGVLYVLMFSSVPELPSHIAYISPWCYQRMPVVLSVPVLDLSDEDAPRTPDVITLDDSDDEGHPALMTVETLCVDRYRLRRDPVCRRRPGQGICLARDRSCRMAIAVLALEAGSLEIKNDARRKVLPLEPGLHFLTWCAANMFYLGSPLARPNTRPLEQNGEFTIEHVNEEAVTWMKISATFEHRPGPASYVFPVEHAPPSLLACFYSGACPNPRLLTHPAVRLEPYLSTATFYHVLYALF